MSDSTSLGPEDKGWWEHMEWRGPKKWARHMFMAATATLAMFDRPLRARLKLAYDNNLRPLYLARERWGAGLENESKELERVFFRFHDALDVDKTLEAMHTMAAEDLAGKITHLSFMVCAKIPES